ncbi:MAG: enolase C-terminal domain-like protein [Candidatus Corynebacterium faecigallinarum]
MTFTDIELNPPFVISGRPMTHISAAQVHLDVATRDGERTTGLGASMLSVPWAWPRAEIDLPARDAVLRSLVQTFTDQVADLDLCADPFALWRPVYDQLDTTLAAAARAAGIDEIPRLAGLITLGAVDSALHDAWARAAGHSAYAMYTAEYLGQDLGWLSTQLAGVYPGDFLGPARREIPIQHALGVGDPLIDAEAPDRVRSLQQWIRDQGIRHLKMKLAGDPEADAARITETRQVMARFPGASTLSVDPNEAYTVPELDRMLDCLEQLDPGAAEAITYLEQPFPRDQESDPEHMARLTGRFPVLLDEGYSRLEQLLELGEQGWSGVVIKAIKGQSHAMITYAAARALGLKIAIQDLTTVGAALEHSLGLAASVQASWPQVEYNSRQFAPAASAELAGRAPELVDVCDGQVQWQADGVGLYGS